MKFTLCLLSVVLLLCFVLIGVILIKSNEKKAINSENYVEGEVLVTIEALPFSDYPTENAYLQALENQARIFADKHNLEVSGGPFPEIAKISGKSIIHLRSRYKTTQELIQMLSSDPAVLTVSPNYTVQLNDF